MKKMKRNDLLARGKVPIILSIFLRARPASSTVFHSVDETSN